MRETTVCFTGHRDIPLRYVRAIELRLEAVLRDLIAKGYTDFAAGGALGFDTLAARMVLWLRDQYPHIKLHLILPCRNQTRGWSMRDIEIYEDILRDADDYLYTSEEYTRGCMHKRNRHLVDMSSVCVCYLTKDKGGTAYTVKYASNNNLRIINIAE